MYIYIYIHINNIYMYMYIHVHICTYIYVYMYIYTASAMTLWQVLSLNPHPSIPQPPSNVNPCRNQRPPPCRGARHAPMLPPCGQL